MLKYVGIGLIVAIIILSFVYNYLRNRKIRQNGMKADAVITRIEEKQNVDAEGSLTISYEYYVTYMNQTGETIEALLGNPPKKSAVGDQIRIQYLPEKPHYVLTVKNP